LVCDVQVFLEERRQPSILGGYFGFDALIERTEELLAYLEWAAERDLASPNSGPENATDTPKDDATLAAECPGPAPTSSVDDDGQAGDNPASNKQDDRDAWLYEQSCDGTRYPEMIATLNVMADPKGKHPEWESIETVPGVKTAVERYCKRHGKTPPPPRKPGRPKK
jgi:hypothetical protein